MVSWFFWQMAAWHFIDLSENFKTKFYAYVGMFSERVLVSSNSMLVTILNSVGSSANGVRGDRILKFPEIIHVQIVAGDVFENLIPENQHWLLY